MSSLRKDAAGVAAHEDPPPFRRVLVANRGEIAIRILRTCRELGIESVAVYSDADATALHVEFADRAVGIGARAPRDSYLSVPALIRAARESGAEAVHPGYGFLSENADFARAVEEAGLVWVGPPPDTIAMLGNKLAARRAAAAAGVPIVPGLTVAVGEGDLPSLDGVGLPAMIKAAAGGGGRGMRRVETADELPAALQAASREAESAFGDGTVYVERLVSPARHVEVQLLGDRHGGLAVLGERDCSVQRRHQKLVEETPSPGIDGAVRAALFESARRVAGMIEFHNAATVEFLVDEAGSHYFLEMNTRLQVEHGVTELVTGIDMVAWQLRVAAGERLPPELLDAPRRGHAIEARIYAEDPYHGFRPVGGTVTTWRLPEGPGVRVDAAVKPGIELTPEYDPLLAKVMVVADDRPSAVRRLRRALDELLVGGLQTDLGFQRWLVDQPAFVSGRYDTGLIPAAWGDDGPPLTDEQRTIAGRAAAAMRDATDGARKAPLGSQPARPRADSEWARQARRAALRGMGDG